MEMEQEYFKNTDPVVKKGLVYYTSNDCDDNILAIVRERLLRVGLPIVSVSLKPIDFGVNIVLPLEKSPLTMYRQQLAGLEKIDADIVFFVEHDVVYPKCHFDYTPIRKDVYYYNENWWKVRSIDGLAVQWKAIQVSGLCAYRELLIEHYIGRIKRTEKRFSRRVGYEPGLHKFPRGIDNYDYEVWKSEIPYVDLIHGRNITRPSYRGDNKGLVDYKLSNYVPFWGRSKGRFDRFLNNIRKEKEEYGSE